MDLAIIAVAFAFGFTAARIGLPPLVGYLAAGFVLHAFGQETTDAIEGIADVGILLLLFGIGLKLRVRNLIRPAILGTTVAFAVIATLVPAVILLGAAAVGLPLASELDLQSSLVVAFGLSFSSTVFAVKALDRTNEGESVTGRVALSVLVLQDLLAVIFVVLVGAEWPSPWLIVVVAAAAVGGPVLGWVLDRTDHGELLILFGFVVALGLGGEVFDRVGLKPDLGALVAGFLLSRHPRAAELSDRLLGFKDLFLVGFFLSIGLEGTPSGGAWIIGLGLVALVPSRSATLYVLLSRFGMRARTALHTSITLSTYSEFGLIVTAAAVSDGLIEGEWLSVLAVAVSGSFIISSATTQRRYDIYRRWRTTLGRFDRSAATDLAAGPMQAQVLIFGMGRVGIGAYDELRENCRGPVVGIERDAARVERHESEGRQVVVGDVLDSDLWDRLATWSGVEVAIVATNNHQANLHCVERAREYLPTARIAAIATYADQIDELREAGADIARNLYEEAGQALGADTVDEVWG